MKLAINLAKKGMGFTSLNPIVGAIIVKDNQIIGKGYHENYGKEHAEVNAINSATKDVKGSTLYVTLEPCCHYGKTPPCTEKIIKSKIKKVVIGALDPTEKVAGKGVQILKDKGIEVVTGVLEDECKDLIKIFTKYHTKNLPYIYSKYAMTLDGKIATITGDSKWISGEKSRKDAHKLRGLLSSIMVGVGTVIADDPMLNCRINGYKSPTRIIVDSHLKTPIDSKIVQTANYIKTIIATASKDEEKIKKYEAKNVKIAKIPLKENKIDVLKLSKYLALTEKIDSILLEGGGELNYSFYNAKLIDKVRVYISPQIFGGTNAKTPVTGDGIQKVSDSIKLQNIKYKKIEQDLVIEGDVINV